MNDLIRKSRELEVIRVRLIEAERSGFTPLSRDQIRGEIRQEMQRNGELTASEVPQVARVTNWPTAEG